MALSNSQALLPSEAAEVFVFLTNWKKAAEQILFPESAFT